MTDSRFIYSGGAEIDLQLHEGSVTLRICDANTSYLEIEIGYLSEYDGDESAFVDDVAREISDSAVDIAETLVDSLKAKVNV